jgi:hypothetical protein
MYNQLIPWLMPQPERTKTMSPELANLIASINLISSLRSKAVGIDFAWDRLYSAEKYLQKQVASHLAE